MAKKKHLPSRIPTGDVNKGLTLKKRPIAGVAKSSSKIAASRAEKSQPAEKDRPKENFFPIVGIGASAGGLEAFKKLLENLPPDTGMAFVLVQHLAPTKDSILTSLLSKETTMPVREVKDNMVVEPDHVYVIPPNTIMNIFHGALRLQPRAEPHTQHMPVDFFFRSLAQDQGPNAIGVVLSGTGSDGSLGIRSIKAEGGIILAQDAQSAKYDGMPKSAAATDAVDYMLPPEKIAAELARISRHPFMASRTEMKTGPQLKAGDGDLHKIFMQIRSATNVDFTYYKQAPILRRIHRRMLVHKIDALEQYIRYLQENPSEITGLYQDILINVTSFFRDPETFTTLKKVIFPRIMENRRSDTPIRVWVPACSTGEEAYSLAMCFSEFSEERNLSPSIRFFASDVDEAAIEKARQGVYPENIAQDVSSERLRRFFTRTERGYQISKAIREQCVFAVQNLIKDPPFSKMDLISCRNLMIYFGPVLQKSALPILYYALNPSGYLMLGRSESVGEFSDLFSVLDKSSRIYSKKASSGQFRFHRGKPLFEEKPGLKKAEEQASAGPDIQKAVDSIILGLYSPAGLVINEDLDILQFRGNISPYLKPQSGKASLNLVKMAGESLAMELRVLIRQALGKEAAVRKKSVKVRYNSSVKTINIEVVAFKTHDSSERMFLVIFEDTDAPAVRGSQKPGKPLAKTKGRIPEERIASLVRELDDTKQHLTSVIADYEASTEELKALNEEVQSSNEELQSINEELETSKEELQSTNEELSTVNDELRNRNEEITEINNDLANVLSGVDIPILLIGNKLQIRRFNSAAAKALNLIASDMGRHISDIRGNINAPNLDKLILEVIDSLTSKQQEIQDQQGRWYSMTIRPYKTIDNRIDGALVTLEDIDDLKISMMSIQKSRDYAEAIIETVREPLIVLSKDLLVINANQAYYSDFGVTRELIENKYFYEIQNSLWNIPKLRVLLEEILPQKTTFKDFEVDYDSPGAGRRILLLNGRKIAHERSELILLAIEDMTEIKKLNSNLQRGLHELASAHKELEAFSYSTSHDLQAPLRVISGFTQILCEDYADKLDTQGREWLSRIKNGSDRMSQLIEDLLGLARISSQVIDPMDYDLSHLVSLVVNNLRDAAPARNVEVVIAKGLRAVVDPNLIKIALENLLDNAWKFTSRTENARIEFGASKKEGETVYFVKDNGAGFDPAYAEKMFLPFQRFHSEKEFEGVGIGLAIVERIIRRHEGKVWAEGEAGKGATIYFTLGQRRAE